MGNDYDQSAMGSLPNHNRRAERAMRANETITKAVPEMLRASPRARHGIHKSDLIVDPSASTTISSPNATLGTHIKIRVQCTDTLSAAAKLSERPFASKRAAPTSKTQTRPNVAVLNMASPIRPGGGFLDGANSQEEFLCARTTLYPSLWDSFYRLPEAGGIYTPDVLVFRDSTPEANDLSKRDRYFVDMLSAGMFRFPDARGRSEDRDSSCTCGVSYCDNDREIVTRKMKAVMRIAESKGAERLVLGAWGCGAYGNPVKEVAKIWRKVIAGGPRQRRPNAEQWDGIKEIVFAIPDRSMVREFERAFTDVLCTDPVTPPSEEPAAERTELSAQDMMIQDLIKKIAETELQLEQMINPRSRLRIKETLKQLNRDLARGLANKAAQEEDLTLQEDEEFDDFVVTGFEASDGEENNFYNFDENDVASDSSDASEVYEFRPQQQTSLPRFTPGGRQGDDAGTDSPLHVNPPSPQFDPQTGWFSGSMDQLARMLRMGHPVAGKSAEDSSPASPVCRPEQAGLDEKTIESYLKRYGGTDDIDDVAALDRPALM
ncbi:hypothetical protein Q7P37_001900 [Cladosporium fusiforme]